FDRVLVYLKHLKRALEKNTATDKGWTFNLNSWLTSLVVFPIVMFVLFVNQSSFMSHVCKVITVFYFGVFAYRGEVMSADFHSPISPPLPSSNGISSPAGREELLPPLTPVQLQYQLHSCCKACLTSYRTMPLSKCQFWGQNPLKVPLLCGFKRLSALPLMSSRGEEIGFENSDVVYKAPCGQSLRNHDDVMRFLLATESYDILQVDFFTFNPSVRLDPPVTAVPRRPELDLSRGVEPTPVELCPGDGGARPPDFRYRKDRWPHGCFLSSGPTLFNVCCDCTDGCTDAQSCTCIAMTRGGQHYTYHRLAGPVPSGLYECGPWCDCERARCQNRLVQRGIRVRLQVFQTVERGWGVRCRDDLDRGTFVCTYAGVVLRRVQSPTEPPPSKLMRCDLPSDDEVEVVTEWLAPPVQKGRSNVLETPPPVSPSTSPPLHVPVIQRPNDTTSTTAQDRDEKKATTSGAANVTKVETDKQSGLKRTVNVEGVYFVDATKEGNVSRFINHSCRPNLFIQNIFTDSHDPGFPVIAFFTNRVVKAGTELTWDYSTDIQTASLPKQEVPCLCGSSSCQGHFTLGCTLIIMFPMCSKPPQEQFYH
uniref:Histone-lysine N-methyltransferase SETDB2 n=1 Tax=Anabas testudineus TaxID=64144 RepID=A0A3Q1JCN5_ANATE